MLSPWSVTSFCCNALCIGNQTELLQSVSNLSCLSPKTIICFQEKTCWVVFLSVVFNVSSRTMLQWAFHTRFIAVTLRVFYSMSTTTSTRALLSPETPHCIVRVGECFLCHQVRGTITGQKNLLHKLIGRLFVSRSCLLMKIWWFGELPDDSHPKFLVGTSTTWQLYWTWKMMTHRFTFRVLADQWKFPVHGQNQLRHCWGRVYFSCHFRENWGLFEVPEWHDNYVLSQDYDWSQPTQIKVFALRFVFSVWDRAFLINSPIPNQNNRVKISQTRQNNCMTASCWIFTQPPNGEWRERFLELRRVNLRIVQAIENDYVECRLWVW